MTTNEAKRIIRDELNRRKLPFTKLTARNVSFSDLARGERIFVKVHGWKPNPQWNDLKELARNNGFNITDAV